jgi:aminoglycoside phosphotransferase (APT) family kinase protein
MGIVRDLVRVEPSGVRRFGAGAEHFVFEVVFTRRKPLVVRMARPENREAIANATRLSRKLRPLGVPLPSILAVELDGEFPYMVIERLPGVDLGRAMRGLSEATLAAIAGKVADAQRLTAAFPTAGRYGYAATGEAAPHASWSAAISGILDRARSRIVAASVFDLSAVEALDWIVLAARTELDGFAATPFLHDATTRNVIVTLDGDFSGIVDVDDLCFGDPRLAAALTQASIDVFQKPNAYVGHWLAASGGVEDRVFHLYVALFLIDFMGEIGHAANGNDPLAGAAQRDRLMAVLAERIDALEVDWGMA